MPAWLVALGVGLVAGFAIRAVFLGGPGLAGDLNDFAAWAGAIGRDGLGRAYDQPISFPPVLPWIWAGLGAVVPGFAAAAASNGTADPFVNTVMKLPAVVADLGLAAVIAYALKERPRVALVAGLATAFHPAALLISAVWGQFESLYVLPVAVAYVLAIRGRLGWAGVALGIALMTKPQALPLALPFVAYALGRGGVRALVAPAVTGALTVGVLWAPFVGAGGPARYLEHLRAYTDLFAVISLRAWNPWWLLQLPFGIDQYIADTNPVVGPITFRVLGALIALLLGAAIAVWVARRPTPESLAWGLVAISLAAFCALTTMHERYLYPAVMLLPLLWPDRRAIVLWVVLSVAFGLNLAASVLAVVSGPNSIVGWPLGAIGAIVITGGLVVAIQRLRSTGRT
jgi:Gpi18-like mannosyltransferase